MADKAFPVLDAYFWESEKFRKQVRAIGDSVGMSNRKDRDSFRHGYGFGKISDDYNQTGHGEALSRSLGVLNEAGAIGNSRAERYSDLRNNEVGMQIAQQTREDVEELQRQYGFDKAEADRRFELMFRERIAQAVQKGWLKQFEAGEDYNK